MCRLKRRPDGESGTGPATALEPWKIVFDTFAHPQYFDECKIKALSTDVACRPDSGHSRTYPEWLKLAGPTTNCRTRPPKTVD